MIRSWETPGLLRNPVIVENANEEISGLNNFDPSNEALIDKDFSDRSHPDLTR
jgi:hypothetical protein